MGTILLVTVMILLILKPEAQRPRVNKKKVIEERIAEAKRIMEEKWQNQSTK